MATCPEAFDVGSTSSTLRAQKSPRSAGFPFANPF
jgi:hypothetical protein